MDKYKKFNKRIIFITLLILFVVSTFNIIMDPYNVFGTPDFGFNKYKPDAKRQERLTKVIGLKLDHRKIDTIFIGTSRVDWAINKNHFKEITGKNAESMAVVGMGFDEYLELAQLCVKIHPEIKNIYLGLDLYTFNKNYKDNQKHIPFDQNPKITTPELATVLFAGDTTISSFITLARNILKTDMSKLYTRNGTRALFHNNLYKEYFNFAFRKYYEHYGDYNFNKDNYQKLADLKYELNKQGVNLIFFHTTGHVTDLDVIYETGMWDTFSQWKKDLTKIADIWDFYYYNKINDCKISADMKEFTDAAHASDLLGNKMIDRMVGKNNEYGRLNTSKNIDAFTKQDKINLLNWRERNPEWIKTIKAQKEFAE